MTQGIIGDFMKKILLAFTTALALTTVMFPASASADSSKPTATQAKAEYDPYWIFQYWDPIEQLCYYKKRTVLGVQWKTYRPPVGICPQTLLY